MKYILAFMALFTLPVIAYDVRDDAQKATRTLVEQASLFPSIRSENKPDAIDSFAAIHDSIVKVSEYLTDTLTGKTRTIAHQFLSFYAQLKAHRIALWHKHHAQNNAKQLQRLNKKIEQAFIDTTNAMEKECLTEMLTANIRLRKWLNPQLFRSGCWWQRIKHTVRTKTEISATTIAGGLTILTILIGGVSYAIICANQDEHKEQDCFTTIQENAAKNTTKINKHDQAELITEFLTW